MSSQKISVFGILKRKEPLKANESDLYLLSKCGIWDHDHGIILNCVRRKSFRRPLWACPWMISRRSSLTAHSGQLLEFAWVCSARGCIQGKPRSLSCVKQGSKPPRRVWEMLLRWNGTRWTRWTGLNRSHIREDSQEAKAKQMAEKKKASSSSSLGSWSFLFPTQASSRCHLPFCLRQASSSKGQGWQGELATWECHNVLEKFAWFSRFSRFWILTCKGLIKNQEWQARMTDCISLIHCDGSVPEAAEGWRCTSRRRLHLVDWGSQELETPPPILHRLPLFLSPRFKASSRPYV